MDKNLDIVADELFGKIRTQFPKIKLGDAESAATDEPELARFFEFDFEKDGASLGTVSVSLSEDDGLVVMYSNDIVAGQPTTVKNKWFNFLRELREFAKQRLLNFETRDISKSNLEKRDYEQQAKQHGEGQMTESKLWGTNRTSFQEVGESKIIVKHTQPVNYDLPAGRTMHIESIYIENAQGERFKYPFKHLNGARAMARHVSNGGTPYDAIGEHVISLSEELGQLRKFKGYVGRNEAISEAMGDITSKVMERIDSVKKEIHQLQSQAHYQAFAESFTADENKDIPEELLNDWIDRLTVRTFNEELKNAFPYIYKLVDETSLPIKELTANDLVSEEADEEVEEKASCEQVEFIQFESFLDNIVSEDNELFNIKTQQQSIQRINDLVSQPFPVGVDGTNAIESLQGLIDDEELNDIFKELSDINPESDARSILKDYITMKDADLAAHINFGEEEPAEVPAEEPAAEVPAEVPAATDMDVTAPAESVDLPFEPDTTSRKHSTPGKHGQEYSDVRSLARKGLERAIAGAKKAGATADTELDFGSKKMRLRDAIEAAGLQVESFFGPEDSLHEKSDEIIEYVKSMYDSETGRFPKGETGVLLSVEKQFGDHAAKVAHKVIGELSQVYESQRLRKLAGLK